MLSPNPSFLAASGLMTPRKDRFGPKAIPFGAFGSAFCPAPGAGQNALPNAPKGIAFGPKRSLRGVMSPEAAKKLGFGESIDGTVVGPDDFSSELSASFEVPIPAGVTGFQLQLDGELG